MPVSAVTRLNAVTYAGTKVGAGTNYHFHGVIRLAQDYTTLRLSFLVICHDPTEATFVTQCTALEDAFRTPNGDLKLEVGGSTPFDLSHANNTGMLGLPTIRKAGSSLDSNNTRLYSCSVTVQLPADESGKSGRQSSKAAYTEDGAEIVRLDVSAVYTAIGANGALAQAKSAGAFPAYITALQGVEGGTWDELDGRVYEHDSDDKFCRASWSGSQVIANQSAGSLNDTTLQGVRIGVRTKTVGPGDAKGSGAKRLQQVTVALSCRVRRSVSTDLENVWTSKIRPHKIGVAKDLSGNSKVTAVETDPGLDPQTNSINARIVFAALRVSLISSKVITSSSEITLDHFEPVLTGRPYDRDRHRRIGNKVASVLAVVFEVDSGHDRALAGFNAAIKVFEGQGYHLKRKATLFDSRDEMDGLGITSPLRLRLRRLQADLEFAIVVGGKGGGGGSQVGTTRTR